jgi:hypothetical protein
MGMKDYFSLLKDSGRNFVDEKAGEGIVVRSRRWR